MSEEINNTGSLSIQDYAKVLTRLTEAQLRDESEKNQWLMGHVQMSPIDYKDRYLACATEWYARKLPELFGIE